MKDYKEFDNDIDYRGGAMDFPYKRITERDKYYWNNDFDRTSYSSLYVRLQYLENKIEDGKLVELPFVVVDKKTKKEADCYKIARKEDWAKCLCYCDMEGFAITQEGMLILLDECGKYTYCPDNRFKVVAESGIEELQENK